MHICCKLIKHTLFIALSILCSSHFLARPYSSTLDICLQKKSEYLKDFKNHLYQELIWKFDRQHKQCITLLTEHLEQILTTSPIHEKASETRLQGATRPFIFNLQEGIQAVFKKKSLHPSGNYKSEIAAYKFDQLIQFNLVPMTVERKVKKQFGSLQYFIRDTKSLPFFTDHTKSSKLLIFDYMIKNKDRNVGNILLLENREIAIDHGLSLRSQNLLGNFLNLVDKAKILLHKKTDPLRRQKFDPSSSQGIFLLQQDLDRMKSIQIEELHTHLSHLISKRKIRKLFDRMQKVISSLSS